MATIVKLTQNSMLGFYTIGIAAAWIKLGPQHEGAQREKEPLVYTLWKKFPKFVIGYLLVSAVTSTAVVQEAGAGDDRRRVLDFVRSVARWFFSAGFVGIGATTSLGALLEQLRTPSVFVLYLGTQALDIVLTLAVAYLAFHLF